MISSFFFPVSYFAKEDELVLGIVSGSSVSLNPNSEFDNDLFGSGTYLISSSLYLSSVLERSISDPSNWVNISSTDIFFRFFRFLSNIEKQMKKNSFYSCKLPKLNYEFLY